MKVPFSSEQLAFLQKRDDKRDAKQSVMVTNAVEKGMRQGTEGQSRQGTGGSGKDTAICYNFRDKGTCRFGDRCRFSH
jgi:ribosomal protein L4